MVGPEKVSGGKAMQVQYLEDFEITGPSLSVWPSPQNFPVILPISCFHLEKD